MIRSDVFDDIYFSPDDGMAETRHVFIDGNHLPGGWAGRDWFTVAETGFGTGLNFLSAWDVFDRTAERGAVLDYLSYERYPLSAAQIESALEPWRGDFGGRLERLLRAYPLRVPGWHRLDFGSVRLTLVFDDVNLAMPRTVVPRGVDAWFLDGFAPAKNPQMWSDTVFDQMARLSAPGARFASFTAAGAVRQGLGRAGFHVEKRKGYGRKRDMIAGYFFPHRVPVLIKRPGRVAIVGGGLAGSACARALRGRGIDHVVFERRDALTEAELSAGADFSGLFNPRFSARRGPESDFYSAGFAMAARTLPHRRTGSLHLINNDDKAKRFSSCIESWGWPAMGGSGAHMAILDAAQASDVAGVRLPTGALFLPESGCIAPVELIGDGLAGSTVRYGGTLDDPSAFDAVIYACAAGVRDIPALSDLPVHTVRGQVALTRSAGLSGALKVNLCYGGYITAAHAGRHTLGSTFQKWLDHTDILEQDNLDILTRLAEAVPGIGIAPGDVIGARAGLRSAAPDHVPMIGRVTDNVYVSTAHGSHGVVSTLIGAHLIADMMEGGIFSLPDDSVNHLNPNRFKDKERKKRE